MCKFVFFLVFLSVFNTTSNAEVRWGIEGFLTGSRAQISEGSFNQANSIFRLPQDQLSAEVRADLKWRSGDTQIVVRPRGTSTQSQINYGQDQSESSSKSKLDLADAFWEQYWGSEISTTTGLQVYQWGPGELLNPTNPFFHFNTRQRSINYKEKGQMLLRINYSLSKEFSIVGAISPVSNNEEEWISEKKFTPKAVLKAEYLWPGTSNLIGLVSGQEDQNNFFVGEYFSWSITESFSLYSEFKHSRNRISYFPIVNGAVVDIGESDLSPLEWGMLGIFGLRWEGEFDLRVEGIYNGAGLNKDNFLLLKQSITNPLNPNYLLNLQRFSRLGLELLGQQYLYSSIRKSDPFGLVDSNLSFRIIYSGQDSSYLTQIEADKIVWESLQVFGNLTNYEGESESEFKLFNDWQYLVGLKWSL